MLQIFIDESGDLGLNEGYFIIALLEAHNPKRLKNLVKNYCAKNKLEEIHACELSFPEKQNLVNSLARKNDYSISYIIADKTMITNVRLFKNNNLLFNYLFSFLIRDIIKSNADDLFIHLDNRTQKVSSVNSLRDYIKLKALTEWGFTKNITIEYHDSKVCKAIQIADLAANCIRRKYFHKQVDFYNRLYIVKSIKFPRKTFRDSI